MKLSKISISLLLLLTHGTTSAMQVPFTNEEKTIVNKALNVELNGGAQQFYAQKSSAELDRLMLLVQHALNDQAILNFYTNKLRISTSQLKSLLNNILQKVTPISVPPLAKDERNTLKKALKAELSNNNAFYPPKTSDYLNRLITLAQDSLNDKASLNSYQNEFRKSIPEIKSLINQVIQKATSYLAPKIKQSVIQQNRIKITTSSNVPTLAPPVMPEKVEAPATIPLITTPIPMVEQPSEKSEIASIISPIITPITPIEQIIEEMEPNQLYIGLDIKDVNFAGQQILWDEPIDYMIFQTAGAQAQFVPNDYFHITIAWHESKDPISKEMVANVERALAHATEILRIVYPYGINGVSLLDKAVLLGRKKNTVAYRVAQSVELKKLQEIFLKFISFEGIQGFKFSTFAPATPLHVTLGKINPAKAGKNFKGIVENLNAPTGTRSSKGQMLTINTFRLTYSIEGQAWQELMSYSF